jgi:hypothetical protein
MSPFYRECDRTDLTRALTFLPVITKNLPRGVDENQGKKSVGRWGKWELFTPSIQLRHLLRSHHLTPD